MAIGIEACASPTAPAAPEAVVPLANGALPYTLQLGPPVACLIGYIGGGGSPMTPMYLDASFDALMIVDDATLSFRLRLDERNYLVREPTGLTVSLTRLGNRVSGTIGSGQTLVRNTSQVAHADGLSSPRSISVPEHDRLAGAPCIVTVADSGTGAPFTGNPRRHSPTMPTSLAGRHLRRARSSWTGPD